mmetsp:Transcript_52553/g.113711  ORF Transcript_52553/g.113711 Transcript_52553/m.113711 type:complete len:156 (-) Transcript_52553:88-555(-)
MANTLEITSGVVETTSRMWLKKEMERFGPVDVCHMGNRSNPQEEPPWVRFVNPQSCEDALASVKAGQVFLDGLMVQAQYKSGRRGPAPSSAPSTRRDLEVSSRDLFMEQERQRIRGGPRERERDRRRSRSRSRSRRRRRSSSRDRGRDRHRRGRD